MRGHETNDHEKLEVKRILCASQCTIPDVAGTSPDLACNNTNTSSSEPNHECIYTDTRSSQPNLACNYADTRSSQPNLACNYTDTSSSQPNQVSRTPDFSCLLVSSTSFSSSSPISLVLMYNSTIIAEHNVKSTLSISPCHDHDWTPSASIHRVQHTPSTAYTEYSIHEVQHTPCTASTQDCWSYLHSDDYELTFECSFSFQHASLHDRPPSASSP